jgi:hypothetical protein
MSPPKIILILMIKNESKIIERCIANALEHVDVRKTICHQCRAIQKLWVQSIHFFSQSPRAM